MASIPRTARQTVSEALGIPTAAKAARQVSAEVAQKRSVSELNAMMHAEFEAFQGSIDASVSPIVKELDESAAAKVRAEREKHLFSNEVDLRIDYQTVDPTEYRERLHRQLRNSKFATRGTFGELNLSYEIQIKKSLNQHLKLVNKLVSGASKNPRWKANVKQWLGDSAYVLDDDVPDVMFHVDRQTDPTRPDSFIQFENPKEMGIHAGTNAAAERIIGSGGIEDVMFRQEKFHNDVLDVEAVLGLPAGEFEVQMGAALNKFFVRRFNKSSGIDYNEIWSEVRDALEAFVEELGASDARVADFISQIEELPTPNTTPFVFKGKNGLLLQDNGGFGPETVASQLEQIFPDDQDEILAALGTVGKREKSKALQKFIESKGFDHIVYLNGIEDRGSVSIINWNPDLQKSIWDPEFTRDDPREQARIATGFVLSLIGLGNAGVREEKPQA